MKLVCCNSLPISGCRSILICSSVHPSNSKGKPARSGSGSGRRDLLLLSTTALQYISDSKTRLLNEYLKKSQENKAKNDKERQDSYYKRNYKDYFGLLEGDLKQKQKKDLSQSENRILEWLQSNQ